MAYRKTESSVVSKIMNSRIVQALLLVFIVGLAIQVYEQYQNANTTLERRVQSERDFSEREAHRQQLDEQVTTLNDPYHIEAEIRRHFDVVKEGEEVVIILEPPPEDESIDEAGVERKRSGPWYRFW